MRIKRDYRLWKDLEKQFQGEFHTSLKWRLLYATDASVYREIPLAVALPRDISDVKLLISFATDNNIPLIPRTAGTSLAGQVVGGGIVVDVSKYLNKIIEIDADVKRVKVQPGVVLDELNIILKPYGLFFAPETSTSNRCMIGGMLGNNSCGAHSLIYGSTRDHTLEVDAVLSDGSEVTFKALSVDEFKTKCSGDTLENKLYRNINDILSDEVIADEIRNQYPDSSLKRRNTGYALDLLLDTEVFKKDSPLFNFCRLLAGSEGTLAFTTAVTLNLEPLPPEHKVLVCVHFNSIEEAFKANLTILEHQPVAVEMMDSIILECTKGNAEHTKNRFFVEGDPAAILVAEFAEHSAEELEKVATGLIEDLKSKSLGFHYPLIKGNDMKRVWDLRKAGLGLLSNVPGDAKPVSVIEDTAVNPVVLPAYMADFKKLLEQYSLECVYYAHIATGELHLKPVLDLKKKKDRELFRTIALESAKLVKKYRGSISGEHGDGRLRGEFIPLIFGEKIYRLFSDIKQTWDPQGIFNPGKITSTPPMNTSLRYKENQKTRELKTIFDFSGTLGLLRAIEQCNGSADCRKSHIIGGTMCPSFMATLDETTTTRARANILREILTNSSKKNPFNHEEIYEVLDLCLSCKGCKGECPSNVDMARYKAEFLYQWQKANGVPLRTRAVAAINSLNNLGAFAPSLFNYFISNRIISNIIKKILGFAQQRNIPKLYNYTFSKWYKRNKKDLIVKGINDKAVCLFVDEFSEYNDVVVAVKTVKLLNALGYGVLITEHSESGRAALSKGILKKARRLAESNVKKLTKTVNKDIPLIGIEPSAILSFRDEYPDLVRGKYKEAARRLADNTFMIDEFIAAEYKKGAFERSLFNENHELIRLHGHCHQKAIVGIESSVIMLEIPLNYKVSEIKSGCCGMAGSFGYEKEHYGLSMKIGELVLFPEIRKETSETLIAAPGTSCRHQIFDGTGRVALHPAEILYDALKAK